MLGEHEADLLTALSADLGKSRFEGWVSEIAMARNEVDYTLEHLARWMKPKRVKTPLAMLPGTSMIIPEPLGVALILAPWNYPLSLVVIPLVGAIAAGNCAVLKPSEVSTHTSALLAKLIPQYCDGAAVVEGGVDETTALLNERFDHIFFTGSTHVGRLVMAAAAKHLTPVTLELGGKSPCIVDASANLAVSARRIVWGKFFNAGQTCVAPDYVLAHQAIAAPLEIELKKAIREFFGDNPKASGDYGRIINERHHRRLTALLAESEIIDGGDHDVTERYIAPTLVRSPKLESLLMQEEIFGPILPILGVASIDEAIKFVNERPKPLALYVFAGDTAVANKVVESTSFGGGCINDTIAHLSAPELPFGGVGASGMGSYHGRASFDAFSHRKAMLVKGTWVDPSLRYPPYTESKFGWVKRLL